VATHFEIRTIIEHLVRENEIEEEHTAAAEVILWGVAGENRADTIAKLSGLNRDKVVRPYVRRLRESGLWTPQGLVLEEPLEVGLSLAILCAMGLITRSENEGSGVSSNEEKDTHAPRTDQLRNREQALPCPPDHFDPGPSEAR
jgi:hypothetical protein